MTWFTSVLNPFLYMCSSCKLEPFSFLSPSTCHTNAMAQPLAPQLVVVAASAGGLFALETLLSGLPKAFPVPLVIVLHLSPRHRSMLAEVLRRYTELSVKQAEEGDPLRPGTVYCAPPDFHTLVTDEGTLTLSHTAQVQHVRPAADVLFESAARAYGETVIAVVLSGTGHDGADGVRVIKEHGGWVMVQDEASATHVGMPRSAIATGAVDWVLPLDRVAGKLLELITSRGTPTAEETS